MNLEKIAKEIIAAETQTSIPQVEIDEAIEIANVIREKLDNLLSEVDLALQDLNGENKPSVLESKDDFKSLVLRLKQMKKKLTVV
jgi:tetrahydromethanopterin S-methyltransferase subunit G